MAGAETHLRQLSCGKYTILENVGHLNNLRHIWTCYHIGKNNVVDS
jgi:hypothetical protein